MHPTYFSRIQKDNLFKKSAHNFLMVKVRRKLKKKLTSPAQEFAPAGQVENNLKLHYTTGSTSPLGADWGHYSAREVCRCGLINFSHFFPHFIRQCHILLQRRRPDKYLQLVFILLKSRLLKSF